MSFKILRFVSPSHVFIKYLYRTRTSAMVSGNECNCTFLCSPFPEPRFQVKVKITLRPTVSRPVRPGVRGPSRISDQFVFVFEIFFRQMRVCYFVEPSLTRGRAKGQQQRLTCKLPGTDRDGYVTIDFNWWNIMDYRTSTKVKETWICKSTRLYIFMV
jgi:hypothetical protein